MWWSIPDASEPRRSLCHLWRRLTWGSFFAMWQVVFVKVTLFFTAWQRFSTRIPFQCGNISFWWMTVLYAVLSEGSEITGVQFQYVALPFTHWHPLRFFETFKDFPHCRRRNKKFPFNLFLKKIFSNILMFLCICCLALIFKNSTFCGSGLYLVMTVITCWYHMSRITSVFSSLIALKGKYVAGLNGINWYILRNARISFQPCKAELQGACCRTFILPSGEKRFGSYYLQWH